MTRSLDLMVVGHIMNETIRFPERTIGPVLGGPAAYSSVAASKLGARTGLVTKIGTDMPRQLLKPLYEAGVDTRGIRVRGAESRSSVLVYNDKGDKTMQYPGIAEPISFMDIPKAYHDAALVYICPLDEWEIPLEVVERLSRLNIRLCVDLGGYGGAHTTESRRGNFEFLEQVLRCIHIAKSSREDCKYLFRDENYSDEKLAELLVERGAEVGIVTLAEKGAIIANKDGVVRIPPLTNEAIDCTGGGDAFGAGFLVEYGKTGDVKRAGIFASATSSLMIEKTGGITVDRMPTLSEVKERIRISNVSSSGEKSVRL